MTIRIKEIIILALITSAAGCANLNDPYRSPYDNGGYNNSYNYNNDYYDSNRDRDYYERERIRKEKHELRQERDRLEDQRRREEEERRRHDNQYHNSPPQYNPQPQQHREERCPSGFRPSENKCSSEERRRGCQDMRLPGGLGCVKR